MPACLMAFLSRFPDIGVTLVETSIQRQTAALESGTVQIGFTIGDVSHLPPWVLHAPIAHSPIHAVLSRSHHLASLSEVSLVDLAREPLLCFSLSKTDSLHGDLVRQIFAARGLSTGPIGQVEGPAAFRAELQGGMGVSLIAEIGGLSRNEGLASIPIKETGKDLFVDLHVLWRGDRDSMTVANFIAVMREVVPLKGRYAGKS
jgi:DNA-binding transcriptional LysR family regulator